MAFQDEPMPDRFALGAIGGPGFNTTVVTVTSGREDRNRNMDAPRWAFEVSQAVKTEEESDAITEHFLNVGGRADWFPMKDWKDYRVTSDQGRVAAITSTTFQLQKAYVSGARTMLRKIVLPKADWFEVAVSGSQLAPDAYTLDPQTGIVTIPSAPAAVSVSWSGEFDVPVRYDTDELKGAIIDRDAETDEFLITYDTIPLIEVRDEDDEA